MHIFKQVLFVHALSFWLLIPSSGPILLPIGRSILSTLKPLGFCTASAGGATSGRLKSELFSHSSGREKCNINTLAGLLSLTAVHHLGGMVSSPCQQGLHPSVCLLCSQCLLPCKPVSPPAIRTAVRLRFYIDDHCFLKQFIPNVNSAHFWSQPAHFGA